jgi:hypothetical protein
VPVKSGMPGLLGAIENVAMDLPETRVITAHPTSLYPKKCRLSELAAASGVPVKRVSLAEARRRARREQDGR